MDDVLRVGQSTNDPRLGAALYSSNRCYARGTGSPTKALSVEWQLADARVPASLSRRGIRDRGWSTGGQDGDGVVRS